MHSASLADIDTPATADFGPGSRAIGRFLAKVDRSMGATQCWRWTASVTGSGYGQFHLEGRRIDAHRAAFTLFVGAIPSGLYVCHRCDNKLCVNPCHLFLATHADNMADMKLKGRSLSGDRNPGRRFPHRLVRGEAVASAKLKESDINPIRQARAAGESQRSVARRYGVTPMTIHYITDGTTWSHVPHRHETIVAPALTIRGPR